MTQTSLAEWGAGDPYDDEPKYGWGAACAMPGVLAPPF
jgi:hypothetical protein